MKAAVFFLFFLNFLVQGRAQWTYIPVKDPKEIPWAMIHNPDKRFALAGEAHQVSIVHPFHLSHVTYLVSQGVRNIILEYPYSYAFFANEYIHTGNDSLLRMAVAGYEETYAYWKGVYELNEQLPASNKIRVWGIDHELGGGWRTSTFKKAVLFIANNERHIPASLLPLLSALELASNNDSVLLIKKQLRQLRDEPEVAAYFGNRYSDFKILVNRLDHYKVSRNDEMLDAFIEIYNTFQLPNDSKFAGQFGWGHVSRTHKKSFAWLLENDPRSPVKQSTFVIGVQYINCISAMPKENMKLENDGIVYNKNEQKILAHYANEDAAPIMIFNNDTSGDTKWRQAADVLFVFTGYPGMTKREHNK